MRARVSIGRRGCTLINWETHSSSQRPSWRHWGKFRISTSLVVSILVTTRCWSWTYHMHFSIAHSYFCNVTSLHIQTRKKSDARKNDARSKEVLHSKLETCDCQVRGREWRTTKSVGEDTIYPDVLKPWWFISSAKKDMHFLESCHWYQASSVIDE